MPTSIDDAYQYASETGKWHLILLTTGVIDESGEAIKPTSKVEVEFLSYKLETLMPYAETNPNLTHVIEQLASNIKEFGRESR